MKVEDNTKEPEVDYTQLAKGGEAPVKGQTHGKRITHLKMASGEWLEIIKGSFHLHKTSEGIPFVEFKVNHCDLLHYDDDNHDGPKTVQLFPVTVAGWAFDE